MNKKLLASSLILSLLIPVINFPVYAETNNQDTISEENVPSEENLEETLSHQPKEEEVEMTPDTMPEEDESGEDSNLQEDKDSLKDVREQPQSDKVSPESSKDTSTEESAKLKNSPEKAVQATQAVKSSQALQKEKTIIEGDTKYFLNTSGYLTYAEVYSNNKLVAIKEFYPNTSHEKADEHVKFIFSLNQNGYIIKAQKLKEDSQQPEIYYEYYPQTLYGKHGKKIKYIFEMNTSGYITSATQREADTQQILAIYQYYPQTSYGSHGSKIKLFFEFNSSGYLNKATQREKNTQRIISAYEYYPGTVYGKHSTSIKYIFDLNKSGNVILASQREKGSQRILTLYEYYPNSSFGKHGDKIIHIFDINKSGHITKATKREKGSQRIQSWFEYYPQTYYGSHSNRIKYIFDIGSSGYINKASMRESGTQRILSVYFYTPKTTYGNHGSKISGLQLNVPLVSQLPQLPTGCEITAVTMMLQYKGAAADKVKLANEMPKHPYSPYFGYVGDPFTKFGWTIYPTALLGLVKKYAGSSINLTGKSNAAIEAHLSNRKPVVVWVSPMHGFSVHAITLIGYDSSNYYFNDPWTGQKNVKINKSEFNKLWSNQEKRAISY
ncbi:MAG: C39 family peptidase [Bacillota bacterium]